MLFYGGCESYFDDRALNILRRHNIKYCFLKAGDYLHDQPNKNDPNTKLNKLYVNSIMNWMIDHGTIKFSPFLINFAFFETWEDLKLSSTTITQKYSKKNNIETLSPPYIGINHQYFLACIQQYNREKSGEIGRISK